MNKSLGHRTVAILSLVFLAHVAAGLLLYWYSSNRLVTIKSFANHTPYRSETAGRVSKADRNFVLAESYWEQMTCATSNFMGLVTVAKHWNARAVWPFTNNSHLYGISGQYSWDLLYDLDDVKQKCSKISLPAPVRFEDFLKTASRRVIAVTIDWESKEGTNQCSKLQESKVINLLNNNTAHHFRIEACCVVYSHQITDGITEIAQECGLRGNESFTAIFKVWRGTTYDKSKTFRLLVPPNSGNKFPKLFNHSKWVIGNATTFFKDITRGTGKCIAVHVRAESLFLSNTTEKCLKSLNQIIKDLKVNYTELTPILVFGDYKLGQIQNMISNGTVTVHFSPKKYKAVADRGFAAQVEQHTMALCQILVLVGGRSFQALTLSRFNTEPSHLFSIRAC